MTKIITCFLILFIVSCTSRRGQQDKESGSGFEPMAGMVEHAMGYKMGSYMGRTVLSVQNPWQGAKHVKYNYILLDVDDTLSKFPGDFIPVKVPVKKVICTSTTHISMLDALDEVNSIVGISGKKLISNEKVQQNIKNNKVIDIGYDQNMDIERILSLQPDLIFSYGITGENLSYLNKLKELGIQVIMNAEYLENTPLGKAEWIKFMAEFYQKRKTGGFIFDTIETKYNKLLKLKDEFGPRPSVISGLPWKDAWYVPGGNSFAANFIEHAGGKYLWEDNENNEAIPLDFEAVVNKAIDADTWINPGAARDMEDILSVDERLKNIKALRVGEVYNNNARVTNQGGNDYWESGVIHPHVILKDLIKIFHPGLLPEHDLVYYQLLSD